MGNIKKGVIEMIIERIWDMINVIGMSNGVIQIFFCSLILVCVFFISKFMKNNIQLYANYKYNNFVEYIFSLTIILGYYIFQGMIG